MIDKDSDAHKAGEEWVRQLADNLLGKRKPTFKERVQKVLGAAFAGVFLVGVFIAMLIGLIKLIEWGF